MCSQNIPPQINQRAETTEREKQTCFFFLKTKYSRKIISLEEKQSLLKYRKKWIRKEQKDIERKMVTITNIHRKYSQKKKIC